MSETNETQTHIATDETYRRIGQGFCGTVWAATTTTESGHAYAYKREDGGPGRSLHNDYIMHQEVLKSLPLNRSRVSIPACHAFIPAHNQTWWETHIPRFPKDFQIPCNVLITDRIIPFSPRTRNTLIDFYCTDSLKQATKSSIPDQDCLIRPYLGRRRLPRLEKKSRFSAFSLRNYPLHMDQISDLGLDSTLYAEIMAETLAELYFRAHIDANDVEFVLAPPNTSNSTTTTNHKSGAQQSTTTTNTPKIIHSHILGPHSIYILDFDCCRPITMDTAGMEQAARAFYKNDPFYPRPPRCGNTKDEDKVLWDIFKDHFLATSKVIIKDQGSSEEEEAQLPALWVHLIENNK